MSDAQGRPLYMAYSFIASYVLAVHVHMIVSLWHQAVTKKGLNQGSLPASGISAAPNNGLIFGDHYFW